MSHCKIITCNVDQQIMYTRRKFIQITALGAGSLVIINGCGTHPGPWRVLTDDESVLLDAIVEQIIPADGWPGAREAGVTNYIDRQLSGPLQRFVGSYRYGLKSLQQNCLAVHGKNFEYLDWHDQTLFLEMMETGRLDKKFWTEVTDKDFFSLVCDHSMQGFYGSPRHGGNKDYISYRMLRIDYPLIIGQNRYK